MQLLRKPIIIILVSSLILNSCKKINFFNIKSDVDIQTKFFSSHRSFNNDENKLIAFLEKRNLEENFILQTVRQIGFPRWNKLIKRTVDKSNVNEISSNSLENRIISKSSESNSNIYYIPFVRNSQNHVNASMIIETTPTDTTLSYVCDWQYKKIPPNQNNREKFAVFFMNFDKNVFGYNKFKITDRDLFKQNGKTASVLELQDKNLSNNLARKDMYNVDYCQDVLIKWNECPYTRCTGENWSCDLCEESCMKSMTLTFCWTEWLDTGGGGSGGGNYDYGSGASGGGGNSLAPPNPCSSITDTDFGTATQDSNTNCDSSSGWDGMIKNLSISDEPDNTIIENDPNLIWWEDYYTDTITYVPQPKPSFQNMNANYPKVGMDDMPVKQLCQLIGGQILSRHTSGNIANGCAIRISRALNYSGVNIPNIPGQTYVGGDGKYYFTYAAHLYKFCLKTFGSPDIHKTVADGAPNGTNFLNSLIGMQNRGIYIMKPKNITEFQASGHATLWGGLDCIGGHNYFAAAGHVYIWKLK